MRCIVCHAPGECRRFILGFVAAVLVTISVGSLMICWVGVAEDLLQPAVPSCRVGPAITPPSPLLPSSFSPLPPPALLLPPLIPLPPLLPGDYRVEECAVPEVGEGEVLVKTLAVGICAGDAKCYAGAPYFWGEQYCPVELWLLGACVTCIISCTS